MPSTPKHAGLVNAERVTPVDVITDESFGLAAVEGRLDVAPPPAAAGSLPSDARASVPVSVAAGFFGG